MIGCVQAGGGPHVRRLRALAGAVLAAGVLAGSAVGSSLPASNGPDPAAVHAQVLSQRPSLSLKDLNDRADRIIGRADAAFSATCGRGVVEVNALRSLRGASSLKVAVALAAIDRANLTPATIASDSSMRAMIIESDNDAANRVIGRAGGLQAITRWMNGLGMTRSALLANYGVDYMSRTKKVTTAGDLRLLADRIRVLAESGGGPLAAMGYTRAQGRALVGLMQRTTHTGLFNAGTSAVVAHKSGWLPGVENDVAIVTLPSGQSCAMALLTDGIGVSRAQAMGAALMRSVVSPLATQRVRR